MSQLSNEESATPARQLEAQQQQQDEQPLFSYETAVQRYKAVLNKSVWGKTLDYSRPENRTTTRIDNYIAWSLMRLDHFEETDELLWESLHVQFEGWSIDTLTLASTSLLKQLRDFLVSHGVYCEQQSGGRSYAKIIMIALEEEEPHPWTYEDIANAERIYKDRFVSYYRDHPLPNVHTNHRGNDTPETPPLVQHDQRDRANQHDHLQRTIEREETDRTTEIRGRTEAREEEPRRAHFPDEEVIRERPQAFQQFNSFTPTPRDNPQRRPSPTRHPSYDQHEQEEPSHEDSRDQAKYIINLSKLYTEDRMKYSGEEYDILNVKLDIFHDLCKTLGIPERCYTIVFKAMLRKQAQEFYYDKLVGRGYTIRTMIEMLQTQFETDERRQKYLTEWRETTFASMMRKFPDKSKLECLKRLFTRLRQAQRGLASEYRTEHNLRDQLINACRDSKECAPALWKPAAEYQALCTDLLAAVSLAIRHDSEEQRGQQSGQYYSDRTYGKAEPDKPKFKGRTDSKVRFGKAPVIRKGRDQQKKKCYVCKKEGCWSSNHTKEERDKAFQQFVQENEGTLSEGEEQDKSEEESDHEEDSEEEEDSACEEHMFTEAGEIDCVRAITALQDQSYEHALTKIDPFQNKAETNSNSEVFTFADRYAAETFQGIMPDSGASGVSTVGEPQLRALQRIDHTIELDRTRAGERTIKFGKGTTKSIGTIGVNTPIGMITFHVLPTKTPFLLCLQDMDRMKVKLDNLQDALIQGDRTIPIVRKWGHPFMLLNKHDESVAYCHLSETEIRQLHRRFGHPSVRKLTRLLERAGYDDIDHHTIEKLTNFCEQCQLHSQAPGRFKFTLKEDREYNYAIIVDVMWLDGKATLHVIDEATGFSAAMFLKDMSAKTAWEAIRRCWIDVYLGPPDCIVHDAGTNFASAEFRQNAHTIGIEVKEVPVEAHNSVGKVERAHAPLRRAYDVIREDLKDDGLSKEDILQMAVKAVNDTAGPDGLVPTLLVFGAYPRLTKNDAPAQSIIRRASAMQMAMKELREIHAKRQVSDALAMRNGPSIAATLNLPLQSLVRVWREKEKVWKGPYKLLNVDGTTVTIQLPYGPTKFRATVVKPFLQEEKEEVREEHRTNQDRTNQDLPNQNPTIEQPRRSWPVVEIPVRRTKSTEEAFITRKEQNDYELAVELRRQGKITTPGLPFELSKQIEIEGLVARGTFAFVKYDPKKHQGRIFKSRIVNEVKGKTTDTPYEKSRCVVQAFNDRGKEKILTQSPTIQRSSQRILLAIAFALLKIDINMILRDITQAYVQSETGLNRVILCGLPAEMKGDYPEGTIMIILKPLYGIPEAGTHWWATYHKHHKKKLHMMTSSYDPCLLLTTSKEAFGIVAMQTDDTLILGDKVFIRKEDVELKKAKLTAKPAEKLSYDNPLMFNGCTIRLNELDINVTQKQQGNKIKLVDMNAPQEERNQQYKEQRARGAYIATICQPEASYDLSIAAQHQDPTDAEINALNKRLQWQIDNIERGIKYIDLDLHHTKLFVFVDGSFANNKDLSSQLGFVIILGNETRGEQTANISGNIIHWASVKSKRVTRSVLASEVYGMVAGADIAHAIQSTLTMIMAQLEIPPPEVIICTDSYSLYECLVKLGTTKEKRLMIDIMGLRQSYERREFTEIRWVDGRDNPADAMTKKSPNKTLENFISTNQLVIRLQGWVERK